MEGKNGRTEPATPKRRQEERDKGNVCLSQEVLTVVSLVLAFFGLRYAIPHDGALLHGAWLEILRTPVGANEIWDGAKVQSWFIKGAFFMVPLLAPVVLLASLGTLMANIAQTGPYFSMQALKMRYDALSPMNGLKQMFSVMSLFHMGLALFKVALVGVTLYILLHDQIPLLMGLTWATPGVFGNWLMQLLFKLAMVVMLLFTVIAAIDYAFQRYKYEQGLMMTKKEVEDERKNQEGPSLVKGAQRRKMRELSLSRMMAAVPKATVIVTNPTHVAIALEYDPATMTAPKVVAKGLRLVAQRIKAIAKENNIPVLERPELARGLYKHVKIGREIPATFFGAVADVMAYLYRLGQGKGFETVRDATARASTNGAEL